MSPRSLSTPPPEDKSSNATTIKYTKKARHGHGQDVTDAHNIRQVAGCLPIDPASKRFLLISSSKNPEAWVIPKGGWETDETQEHAALRETWEEAGLKGRITRQLGVFVERANKKIRAHHWIFEMEIDEIVKKYPERMRRDRRWFTFEEALIATANNPYIQEAIRLSSISPLPRQTTPQNAPKPLTQQPETAAIDSPPSSVPSTPTKSTATIESPSVQESRKSNDAFQALRELMEQTAATA
ncbi:NUDIX hydrolase domain-like protein [Mucor lusitanicus]|uniref:NUDIX hydrolase domain-like protein n=2 Tax=Mucor circinelloides f. lusitanicus TaxID=29924 RepID=A0A8H4BJC3_MUCCL|nr:NUDIX hydrolase domain-like protein [Mucor lusitanicus]